uniref:Uncharacterized protein n=1 Tax=Parascaris equorum TaxID=6256 RepID=A0A914RT38_PAREQ
MLPKCADPYQLRSAANAFLPFLVHYHVAFSGRASVYWQNSTQLLPFRLYDNVLRNGSPLFDELFFHAQANLY